MANSQAGAGWVVGDPAAVGGRAAVLPRRGGSARAARARRGIRVAGLALAADLVDLAVVARAVDVELAPVALDDQEGLAVALAARVVDEHPVARAGDDLDVAVTGDLLRALALRRARRGVLAAVGRGLRVL